MKKIIFLIILFSSIASFSQEQLMLEVDLLLNNNGNGKLRVTDSSGQTLYENFGVVDNYGMILNLSSANFPITLTWRAGLNAGCTTQSWTYTWSEYFDGKTFTGGCAPEYFYLRSPYINKATVPVGVCETIAGGFYVSYYSTTGSAPWTLIQAPYTTESILGASFRGALHVKSDIDSYYANPKVTMSSKVTTLTIIGCSPELDGQPIPEKTKCKFESSGSATIKFKTDLKDGDKFLFNIFKNGVFDKSIFVTKDQIINKTYIWTGLAEGNYFIKYQAQAIADGTTLITGSTAIQSDPFPVGSPDPLTFTITQLQPNCHNQQGAVTVTATGGTSPYYYMIDSETLAQKHPLTAVPIELSEGDHKVKVVDSNSCTEK